MSAVAGEKSSEQIAETVAAVAGSYADNEARRLGVWFLILMLLLATLILVGGIVRISGSGLSIPEWPIINGSLLPPLHESGWRTVYETYYRQIHSLELPAAMSLQQPSDNRFMTLSAFQIMFAIEYTHRLLAALLGIVFLALALQIYKNPRLRRYCGKRVGAMMALLIFQAVLGGIVVKLDLKAELVAVHLGVAFLFFALVLWTTLQLFRLSQTTAATVVVAEPPNRRRTLYRLSWLALATVYIQTLMGGLVAGLHAGYLFNTWPMMGDRLIPPSSALWHQDIQPLIFNLFTNQVLVQFVHRWWAFVAALAVFVLLFASLHRSLREQVGGRARLALRGLGSLVVLQILLGIMTLVARVPAVLAATHLMVGLALFGVLVWATFELKYETAKEQS